MTQTWQERQIRWRCHRGMLELDIILINFFDKAYAELPQEDQSLLIALLELPDPKLWYWFLHPEESEERFKLLVEKIIAKTSDLLPMSDQCF